MFYEITIEYDKVLDNGMLKRARELYFTDCEFFSEAETVALKHFSGADNPDVTRVSRMKIMEVVNPQDEREYYFRATVIAETIDDNGNPKEQKYLLLVRAENIDEATRLMQNYMKQGLEDMRLDALVKTRLIEQI